MRTMISRSGLLDLFRRGTNATDSAVAARLSETGTPDIRSGGPSASRDLSAHRRATWLYEDMLN